MTTLEKMSVLQLDHVAREPGVAFVRKQHSFPNLSDSRPIYLTPSHRAHPCCWPSAHGVAASRASVAGGQLRRRASRACRRLVVYGGSRVHPFILSSPSSSSS